MKKPSKTQVLFVFITVLNWVFSVGFAWRLGTMKEVELLKSTDDIHVDGTDFTPIINLVIMGVNGFVEFMTTGLFVALCTICIMTFALILWFKIFKGEQIFTRSEVKFTKWTIILSSILAFGAAIFCVGLKSSWCAMLLSWQQPLFMWLFYYRTMRKQFDDGTGYIIDKKFS